MPDHASGQPLPGWVTWACCDRVHSDGTPCTGAAHVDYGRCLAHLDGTQLASVMSPRPDEALPDLDARGVRLASDDLKRLLAAARSEDGLLSLGDVLLGGATVEDDVLLDGATVEGRVSLDRATVKGRVSLDGATVEGRVFLGGTVEGGVFLGGTRVGGEVFLVGGARVGGDVFLGEATVEGGVSLGGATVGGDVFLRRATVKGRVSLDRTMVEGGVLLDGATVEGRVFLDGATVEGGVLLGGATVEGGVFFVGGTTVKGDVFLRGATVKGEALLGPMSATRLRLEGTEFIQPVSLDVVAERLVLSGARFRGGVTARVGDAEVAMERVEVQRSLVLAHATGLIAPASPPRLLQLVGTDVASLTLTGVDLRACRFSGAINLDKVRIDGSPQLAMREGWQAHRRVLAEEHVWRHEHGPARRRDGWYPTECRPRNPDEARRILETEASAGRRERAQEIAAVYRALRKGREDSKDEPGAADFYYGEMEMRRKAAGGSVEGMLLTGYWLLSGYGLRAWRALTALVALISIATVLFATIGLAHTSVTVYRRVPASPSNPAMIEYRTTEEPGPRPGWATALNYSLQSTTSLLRSPSSPPPLTGFGQTLEIFLRFAGPGLLALAVLALRAGVKR